MDEKTCEELEEWIQLREKTIATVRKTIQELEKIDRNVKTASLTVEIVSSAVHGFSTTGKVMYRPLAPVFLITGIVTTLLGKLIVAGGNLIEMTKKHKKTEKLRIILETDINHLKTICGRIKKLDKPLKDILQETDDKMLQLNTKMHPLQSILDSFSTSSIGLLRSITEKIDKSCGLRERKKKLKELNELLTHLEKELKHWKLKYESYCRFKNKYTTSSCLNACCILLAVLIVGMIIVQAICGYILNKYLEQF